eukprot:15332944-Ditylum_brightwellii.AAC.1
MKCATTQGNKSKRAVDGIWGTMGIKIEEGGYLPFHECIMSDHRLLWIRIQLAYMFGHPEAAMCKPCARNLRMDHKKGQKICSDTSRAFLKAHKVKERLGALNAEATFPPIEAQYQAYKAIDKIQMMARRKGIRRCRQMY